VCFILELPPQQILLPQREHHRKQLVEAFLLTVSARFASKGDERIIVLNFHRNISDVEVQCARKSIELLK
jgi:hypothetical protein